MKNQNKINIVMADDHPIFRSGLRQVIEEEANINILGEADNGEKAIELIEKFNPDIVLLDIEMPRMTGLEVLREIGKMKVKPKAIFLSVYADEDIFDEAMELGISGYILKDSAINDVVECINKVNEGNYYISPGVSNLLLSQKERQKKFKNTDSVFSKLTKTEITILNLISEGNTSKDISEKLGSSFKTIENHRSNISNKLDLKGVNSLIKFAIEHRSDLMKYLKI
ncbi:MAG TPA: response regulator transcription factor [Ignavibacteria bacterium]|nr:response regulator transcription factor [Ignavibacteria bacterium]